MSSLNVLAFLFLSAPAALTLSACGGKKAPAHPELEPVQQAEEAADEDWDTSETSEKPNAKGEPEGPALRTSGRPALKLRHNSLIDASIDETGAELALEEGATLVFPVGALSKPVTYHFAQRRGTPGPKRIGRNYEFAPEVTSVGEPFVLELPLPAWAKKANFAMLKTRIQSGEAGKGWTVVAATRLDHDKGIAILETTHLPEGWIYLTPQSAD